MNTRGKKTKNPEEDYVEEEEGGAGEGYDSWDDEDVGSDVLDSEEESEDETGALLAPELDVKIFETIEAIRKKDPRVYDPNFKFFDENLDDEAEEGKEVKKEDGKKADPSAPIAPAAKSVPVSRNEFLQRHLLAGSGADEDQAAKKGKKGGKKEVESAYADEQAKIKQALMSALSGAGNDEEDDEEGLGDELFARKRKTEEELLKEEKEYQEFLAKKDAQGTHLDDLSKLSRYMDDSALNTDEQFLRKYVIEQMWIDKSDVGLPKHKESSAAAAGEDGDNSEGEEEEEKAELPQYRFQESGALDLSRHSRAAGRKKESARNRKRQLKKQVNEHKQQEREEALKAMKGEKKEELLVRLRALLSGAPGFAAELDDDAEFDPEEHDKKMQEVYGEDYYAEGEEGEEKGEKEGAVDWASGDIEGIAKSHLSNPSVSEDTKHALRRILDEYYALDQEELEDDEPMKFRYREVEPAHFGLSIEQILSLDERDLAMLVPLSDLAPYAPPKKYSVKNQLKQMIHDKSKERRKAGKKSLKDLVAKKGKKRELSGEAEAAAADSEPRKAKKPKKEKVAEATSEPKLEIEKMDFSAPTEKKSLFEEDDGDDFAAPPPPKQQRKSAEPQQQQKTVSAAAVESVAEVKQDSVEKTQQQEESQEQQKKKSSKRGTKKRGSGKKGKPQSEAVAE